MESQQRAAVGIVGLGVMGENLALNLERNGFSVARFDLDADKRDAVHPAHATASARSGPLAGRDGGGAATAATDPADGARRRRGGRRAGRPAAAARARRRRHRRRQHPLHRHAAAHAGARRHRHPVRGRRRERRRGGRAARPVADARRRRAGLAAGAADAAGDRRQGRRRPALLRVDGPGRRRPLRQDGPQRHRVRRHADHLRGLLADARAAGPDPGADERRLRRSGTKASCTATWSASPPRSWRAPTRRPASRWWT